MGCTPAGSGTDGCAPASATALFQRSGTNTLTVTLTNTTLNPSQTSQNLSAFSFVVNNSGGPAITATLTGSTGNEIASMPAPGSPITVTGPTTLTWGTTHAGTAMNTGGSFQTIFAGGVGSNPGVNGGALDSIVGTPIAVTGGMGYTSAGVNCTMMLGPNNGCGSSNQFGTFAGDSPNYFEKAVFTFTLSDTPNSILGNGASCASGDLCISSVQYGFGPDGPDADDVTVGTSVPVPAPLIGFGIPAFLAIAGLWVGFNLIQRSRGGAAA